MAGAISLFGNVLFGLPSRANQINYDNTNSGLSATQVQAAIDELNGDLTIQTTPINTDKAVGTAYKMGNIISINIYNGTFFSADVEDVLLTLPEGYRPNAEISLLNGIGNKQRIAIYADGHVVAKEAFANTYLRFCATFIKA